jgi:hypothetical protein
MEVGGGMHDLVYAFTWKFAACQCQSEGIADRDVEAPLGAVAGPVAGYQGVIAPICSTADGRRPAGMDRMALIARLWGP